jgi:tetratricopeptide (TPR) repeat protein
MNPPLSRLLRLLAALPAVLLLALAGLDSVNIYRAERLAENVTVEELEKAVRLTPVNSGAWVRLGVLRDRQGDAAGARAALERAVELNRYNAGAWIELGLHWEVEGHADRAEQCLLEAVRFDGTFPPRWALANFYLRQGGGDRFWTVIREAIERNRSEDPTPAVDLCWRASDDPDQILEKAIPDDRDINRRYYQYLNSSGRAGAVPGVWKRIEHTLEKSDLDMTLRYVDALLALRQGDAAMQVWNRLSQAGLIQYPTLDPSRGRVLTNGNFLRVPLGMAFDWGLPPAPGVDGSVESAQGKPHLRFRFDGAHPEATDLLTQWAPVEERRTYRLSWRYTTEGLPGDTGLYWRMEDPTTPGSPLRAGAPLPASRDEWREAQITFQSGPRTRLIRLVFAYRRSPGTTRAEGSISLRDLTLSPADPDPASGRLPRRTQP